MESGKALKEASISLKKMMKSSSYDIHIINSQSACKTLSTLLKSGILNDVEPLQMVSLLTTVSLLNDIVHLTEKISESVRELASAASFKNKMKPTEPTVSRSRILEALVVPCQLILVMVIMLSRSY